MRGRVARSGRTGARARLGRSPFAGERNKEQRFCPTSKRSRTRHMRSRSRVRFHARAARMRVSTRAWRRTRSSPISSRVPAVRAREPRSALVSAQSEDPRGCGRSTTAREKRVSPTPSDPRRCCFQREGRSSGTAASRSFRQSAARCRIGTKRRSRPDLNCAPRHRGVLPDRSPRRGDTY